jgi:hypothetical protein
MFIKVDLPDPDGPIIATNSPASMQSDVGCKAATAAEPDRYDLLMSRASISIVDIPSLRATNIRPENPKTY